MRTNGDRSQTINVLLLLELVTSSSLSLSPLLTSWLSTMATMPSLLPLRESGTCYHWRSRHCHHCRLSSMHWRRNRFADRTTMHTSGNSSTDTGLIRWHLLRPEVLFETCVAMKFVDDDDIIKYYHLFWLLLLLRLLLLLSLPQLLFSLLLETSIITVTQVRKLWQQSTMKKMLVSRNY